MRREKEVFEHGRWKWLRTGASLSQILEQIALTKFLRIPLLGGYGSRVFGATAFFGYVPLKTSICS
jgi:hypothetical protein